MNDLNSVLLEGVITATVIEPEATRPRYMDIKNYGELGGHTKKIIWTKCRIDISKCSSRCISDLVTGRKVRIVGRLAKFGKSVIGIMAEHIELKPLNKEAS